MLQASEMWKWKLSEPLAQQLLYLIWLLHVLIWPLPHLPVYDFFNSWYSPSLTYLSMITSWYGPPSPTCLWPQLPVYDFWKIFGRHVWHTQKYQCSHFRLCSAPRRLCLPILTSPATPGYTPSWWWWLGYKQRPPTFHAVSRKSIE